MSGGLGKYYKRNLIPKLRAPMETKRLFSASGSSETLEVERGILFLSLLLNPDVGSPSTVAPGASKSNLFFSKMYGASVKPNLGLKPRDSAS
jgi:hypothetical protein